MPPRKVLFRDICLGAALLTVLAWPAHVVFADKDLADLNCPVSSLTCSSELNSDCGSEILAAPENFILVKLNTPVPAAAGALIRPFFGRAPPLV
jgi:hypothetical protein